MDLLCYIIPPKVLLQKVSYMLETSIEYIYAKVLLIHAIHNNALPEQIVLIFLPNPITAYRGSSTIALSIEISIPTEHPASKQNAISISHPPHRSR